MIESQLRTLFTEIADEEPGPPQVDTDLARRRGRARLRRRRASLAGVPAVAAAAAVLVALAVGTAPARPARPAATGPLPAGPGAPRQFNPLVPYVSFGWLPPGQSLLSGGSNLMAMSLIAAPRPGARSQWGLTVYAAGQCHLTAPARRLACSTARFNGLTARFSSRAPDVRGHRAFWAGQYLVWSYARGGWAWLTLPVSYGGAPPGLAGQDAARRDAVKIADHVRFGAGTPLVFPAQLIGLPARWRVSSAYYQPDAGVLRVSQYALTRGVPNFGGNGILEYDRNMPNLMINPGAERRTPCGPATSEIINGYRVIVAHRGLGIYPGQELCAADAGGLTLKIEQFGSHPAMSVTSLFRDHLRLLGPNPADWTTEPIG